VFIFISIFFRLRARKYDLNIGPSDPFSGMACAFIDSATAIGHGLGDFGGSTQELFKLIFEKQSTCSGKKSAFATGIMSIRKITINVARIPIGIGFAFTQGLHNAPKLWGDCDVEPSEPIEGISSGIKIGAKVITLISSISNS
jgi:hypothetical protein